ncbi:Mitochondrial import receptor subunit TOM9-2 [Platanthera guangdongensis]|uniref:Mitochondrial import receptor subunit TOM9-2 n=1 Tax=Platanthera guangdongensis TaxID=2320717 RepID=A0ABR2MN16_9ASPA
MASQSRRFPAKGRDDSILAKLSQSAVVVRGREAASEATTVAKKLLRSTGKAAWIAGTTFLVLVVPLIIEMDREAQMNELEMQQASLLGTPPPSLAPPPAK